MSMTKIFRMFLSLVSVMLLVAILFVFSTKDEIPQGGERGPTSAGTSNIHGTIPRVRSVDETQTKMKHNVKFLQKRPTKKPKVRSVDETQTKMKRNVKFLQRRPTKKPKFSTKDEIPHGGERGPTSAGASNLHGTIPRKLCVDGVIPLKTFTRYDPDADIDLAVVSAYFDIGRFKKGLSKGLYFNASTYTAWAGAFSHLYNPLVFYTDSEFFENIVKKLRIHLPRNLTRIIRINQTSMWSFKLRDRISAIYQNPDYPKFYPNTVVPNYSCAMHAKYEVVENAILNKYVTSDYVTWLDVGYFRYLKRNKPFKLVVPKSFSDNTVAFNKLHHPDRFSEPEVIFKNNSLYVGGGMFIGRPQIMLLFILDYRHASEVLLHRGLSNTDQQVLYAMYNSNFRSRVNPGVDIQLFKSNIVGDCWFYLGYQCYRELQ